jgi:hypothetical protein
VDGWGSRENRAVETTPTAAERSVTKLEIVSERQGSSDRCVDSSHADRLEMAAAAWRATGDVKALRRALLDLLGRLE